MLETLCKDCGRTHDRALTDCTIPEAAYYVMTHDTFMSSWEFNGRLRNTPVVPCATYSQARAVQRYIEGRRDQKNVRIVLHKPRHRQGRVLNVVLAWLDGAARLQEAGVY